MLYIGIDPGVKNLGLAWKRDNGEISTITLNPSDFKKLSDFCNHLNEFLEINPEEGGRAVIERFVSYEDKLTSIGEDVLMLIGATVHFLQERGIQVKLLRAIDWKHPLCAILAKKGFENPGNGGSLDKKFSLAAFQFIYKVRVKKDHEADAGCLCAFAAGDVR